MLVLTNVFDIDVDNFKYPEDILTEFAENFIYCYTVSVEKSFDFYKNHHISVEVLSGVVRQTSDNCVSEDEYIHFISVSDFLDKMKFLDMINVDTIKELMISESSDSFLQALKKLYLRTLDDLSELKIVTHEAYSNGVIKHMKTKFDFDVVNENDDFKFYSNNTLMCTLKYVEADYFKINNNFYQLVLEQKS